MTLAQLTAKRGALTANLEQLVGRINRVNGAIAVIDELIAELPQPASVPHDVHGNEITVEQMDAQMGYKQRSAPKEMLPITYDEPAQSETAT